MLLLLALHRLEVDEAPPQSSDVRVDVGEVLPRARLALGGQQLSPVERLLQRFCEKGLTRSAPLSTREKPENSDSTRTPAGSFAKERVSAYSSGQTLMPPDGGKRPSLCCHSSMRAAVEIPGRSS